MIKLDFDKVDEIHFKDKVFVLTGDFLHGSKEFFQEWIEYHGGICKSSVVKNTNYLVIGKLGSAKWKFGSSGGMKLEKLRELKFKGKEIFTIKEDQLLGTLLSKVGITDPSKFRYEDIGDGIRITNYTGRHDYLRIPNEIEGKPVLEIGEYAIGSAKSQKTKLRLVILPDSLIKINLGAFERNINLCYVILPNKLKEIGERAFWGCNRLFNLRIPSSVEKMGENIFGYCWGLNNLEIIYKDKNLEELSIHIRMIKKDESEGILLSIEESINSNDLQQDKATYYINRKNRYLDEFVTCINKDTKELGFNFKLYDQYINSLSSVSIKPLIVFCRLSNPILLDETRKTDLSNYLAGSCSELFTKLKLLSGVKLIADNGGFNIENIDKWIQETINGNFEQGTAFLMDYKNRNISEDDIQRKIEKELNKDPYSKEEIMKLWRFKANDEGGYTIISYKGEDVEIEIPPFIGKKNVTKIEFNTFKNKKNIISVIVPYTVNEIGKDCFSFCHNLEAIYLPDSLVTIGDGSFEFCSSLERISIPSSVKKIGSYAFSGCSRISDFSLPNRLEELGEGVFAFCNQLDTFRFIEEKSEKSAGNYTIVDGIIYKKDLNEIVMVPPGRKEEVYLLDCVTSIAKGAFYSCSKLESIIIPDEVAEIGESAFYYCIKLESIQIPPKVLKIGKATFFDCNTLKEINLNEGLEEIGEGAFYNCESLKSIYIPESVTHIDKVTKFSHNNTFPYGILIMAPKDSYAIKYAKEHHMKYEEV